MKGLRNHKHRVGLILILVGLIIFATPVWEPTASAQSPATSPSWAFTGSLNADRFGHTATLLPNGKVLVAGGGSFPCSSNSCSSPTVNGSAELYDPANGTWSLTGNLLQRRTGHSATLLQNGQVLVVGGYNYGYDIGVFSRVNSAELYDPATGRWHATASPISSYIHNSATLLNNGKILAVFVKNPQSQGLSAELYDPATATWNSTDAPTTLGLLTPLFDGKMTTLFNGKVLNVSGNSSELYDPVTGRWTIAGGSNLIRVVNMATILSNGKVLVTGVGGSSQTFHAALYDPSSGTWSSTGNPNTIGGGPATLLPNGNVLVAGGVTCSALECLSLDSAELYDHVTGTWRLTNHLNTIRSGHSATLLLNGRVLVAGGNGSHIDIYDFPIGLTSAELYDPATSSTINQIDDAGSFVRQHYRDFLNREPDANGLAFWTNEITSCGADQSCIEAKRINVSAAFFLSLEFQQTGYLVNRIYKSSYGDLPGMPVPIKLNDFLPDSQGISQGVIVNQAGWEQVLENNKQTFASDFVQRSRFTSAFPTLMTPTEFVDKLFANAGLTLSGADYLAAINEFGSTPGTDDAAARARALRRVAESSTLAQQEFNRAFVLMQYFGYLHRNPNDAPEPGLNFDGYNFWLTKLTQFNGDYLGAEMVKAFIVSSEYRQRFGP